MKIPVLIFLVLTFYITPAQDHDPFIQSIVDQVEYDSVLSYLMDFENLGIKDIYSDELKETAEWLEDKYAGFGYTEIHRDTFYHSGQELYNLVVKKEGGKFPDTYLIVDGHYDTWNGPGVNDNGSGVAVILEAARLLAPMETEYSVLFINFSAEEVGLVGSSHYVDNVVNPNDMDIRLVFNIDEVGGIAGLDNHTIICERDESSPSGNDADSWAFTDTLVNLTHLYSALDTEISYAYGSDYVPFQQNGEVITGYFEYNYSPYPHTINDSLSKLDTSYVYELAKATTGATMYFAGAYDPVGSNEIASLELDIYPNPCKEGFYFSHPAEADKGLLEIYSLTGRLVKSETIRKAKQWVALKDCPAGAYLYIFICESRELDRGLVIRKD